MHSLAASAIVKAELASGSPNIQLIEQLGIQHQLLTPYTSFVALETDEMFEQEVSPNTVGVKEANRTMTDDAITTNELGNAVCSLLCN